MAIVLGCNLGLAHEKPLRYAGRDAQQVYSTLAQLGGMDAGKGYLLQDPKVEQVRKVFAEARNRIRHTRASGEKLQILIYFSGHGSTEALHISGETLPLAEIRAYFKEVEADLKLLIADACHSGALIQSKGASLAPAVPLHYQDELKVNGSAILTSSSAGELSQESQELRGSLFTHYFLSGLRGAADFDRDGQITLWEAYNHSQSGMRRRLAPMKEVVQTPGFDLDIQGSDNVVLTRLSMGQAFLDLKGLPEGEYRILEAQGGLPFAEVTLMGPEGATLALPKAAYMVYRPGARSGSAAYADLRKSARLVLAPKDFSPFQADRMASKGSQEWYGAPEPLWTPVAVTLQPRLYPAFPGRPNRSIALETALRGGVGDFSLQAGFAWLRSARLATGITTLDQKGYGISGQVQYVRNVAGPLGAAVGPRMEWWTLDQALNGKSQGQAKALGSFAGLGFDLRLPYSMRLTLGAEAGWFWSYDPAGTLRQDPAYPVSFSIGYYP